MPAFSEHAVRDPADDQIDSLGSIVADMTSLLGHVQASISRIEAAIRRETGSHDDDTGDVMVLDDVTPCYAKATSALSACSIGLDAALQSLLGISHSRAMPSR